MVYWDTSALLKLYVMERESAQIVEVATSAGSPIFTSAIAAVEMISALARKEEAGELKRGGSRVVFSKVGQDVAVGRISLIPFGDEVVREAARLVRFADRPASPPVIRALDLIHLGTAAASRSKCVVTTDKRMRELARHAGFDVLPQLPY